VSVPVKVRIQDKLRLIEAPYVPKIVGELNGQYVKLVRFEGAYVWHHHDDEDELFLVVDGAIEIHFRDGVVALERGELLVVPRGVEHRPVARSAAHVMLFEPASTRNTGRVDHAYTIEPADLERI
jgi:mannose-6-phosphate isomerase-like protein (cupin superfamily)